MSGAGGGGGGVGAAPPSAADKFRMELLMERLRTKAPQYKTLHDTSKAVRMTMLDKRWALDSADRAILQKCLDSLQHRIKVTSLQSLVERLECLSRQLGLKFVVGASGVDLFISSDMFYLEIILEPSGAVKDVKIHHEGKNEQQSCEELVSCISRGDFTDFTIQLEGLTSVYQLNAQKNVKSKAFSALTALETDLGTLSQLQVCLKDPWVQVHKSPIGFVQKRRGGHAMKLIYFVSPYEVARLPGGVLTSEALSNGVGSSALLLLESATAHRLQLSPLVLLPQRMQPNNGPTYSPMGPNNSATLPARFILKLSQPMPFCTSLLKMIIATGDSENSNPAPLSLSPLLMNTKPLLSLVANHFAGTDINPNKGLFVSLTDQNQCYFLTETQGLEGNVVESIPFTHPSQVPTLIACLRQQALFNTLISSCVRPNSKQDIEASIMLEITALSWQHISVALEQPGDGGMATLEFELPEGGGTPHITVLGGVGNNSMYEEYLARVLQRTLSIPLTVRALLARWERDSRPGFSGGAGGIDSGGPPTSPRPHYSTHTHQNNFINDSHQNIFANQDGNINSMLGNGNNINNGMQNNQNSINMSTQQSTYEDSKMSKKRKSEFDIGGSSKRSKPRVLCEVLLESSSSNCDSAEDSEMEEENINQSNSSNEEEEHVTSPTSQVGFTSDLELSGLDPTELIGGSSNDNKTSCSDFDNSGDGELNEIQEMDEIIRSTSNSSAFESKKIKQKSRENRDHRSTKMNTASLLMELEGSGFMPSSVSITPITSSVPQSSNSNSSPNFSSALTGMGLDRRPGIEIIPITSSPQTSLSNSITIIPIPSQNKSVDDRHKSEKKSSTSSKSVRSDNTDRGKEKKKKKRREDSMGPPDKLPPKQDPLTKPVSVSIKPTDRSNSPLTMRSTSPNSLMRKFSPSPTHGKSVTISKSSGSPSNIKSMGKPSGSSSHHNSPRHSPVQCSPKHSLSGYSSPKNHGTSSPKHSSSSGSSGKPSMSTLKSATSGSPSSKSSSGSYDLSKLSKMSSSKDGSVSSSSGSKDKERKSSNVSFSSNSGSSSPKLKSSSVKLKQLDLSVTLADAQNITPSGDTTISPIVDLGKSTTANQVRNRKGSLSAVIDKLKSAQHCGSDIDITGKSSGNSKDRSISSSNKITDSKTTNVSGNSKLSDNKTQEYMVKPSSDGMKITINKTRMKDSANTSTKSLNFSGSSNLGTSSSSSSLKQVTASLLSSGGTGSPKTHTGLKPGVISGPASKKPQVLQSCKSGTIFNSTTLNSSQNSSNPSSKSNSPSNLSTGVKIPFTKSSSSSSLPSSSMSKPSSKSSSGSPKMSNSATDLSKLTRDRDREKIRSMKSGSLSSGNNNEKSIFASNKNSEKRLSPAPTKDDIDGDRSFKSLSQHTKDPNFVVESLTKSLDTSKYQIPKLSARVSDDSKMRNAVNTEKTSVLSSPQTDISVLPNRSAINESPKLLEYMGRSQEMLGSKFAYQHLSNTKMTDQIQKSQTSIVPSKPLVSLSSTSPKLPPNPISLFSSLKSNDSSSNIQGSAFTFGDLAKSQQDSSKDAKPVDLGRINSNQQSNPGTPRDDISTSKTDYIKSFPPISVCSTENLSQSTNKQLDISISKTFSVPLMKTSPEESRKGVSSDVNMKNVSMLKSTPSASHESTDILLDFSNSKSSDMKNKMPLDRNICVNTSTSIKHTSPLTSMSQSPSLSVRIVKSPAPSPLVILSPHSNSPCITDDELMDEAVVGPGK